MYQADIEWFARKLMSSIEYDMDNNEKVDPSRMFTFTRMLPMIIKIKEYEDVVAQNSNGESKPVEITPEFINKINEEFLGIKCDEL